MGERGRLFHEVLWDAVLAIDLGGSRIEPATFARGGARVGGVGRRHGRGGGDLPRVQPRELGRRGCRIAASTDTPFALGLLTLFGRRAPDRLRAYMLTVVIADDLLALVVIALVYTWATPAARADL